MDQWRAVLNRNEFSGFINVAHFLTEDLLAPWKCLALWNWHIRTKCQKIKRKLLKTPNLRMSRRGSLVDVPYLSSCYYNQTANSVPQYYRVTLAPPKLPTTASVSCLLFRSFHLKTHEQSRVATHSLTHPHTLFIPVIYHPLPPAASVDASPNKQPQITECLMGSTADTTIHYTGRLVSSIPTFATKLSQN